MNKPKASKKAAKATKKATKPAKAPAADKHTKKPTKSAAKVNEGVYIAPIEDDDATEATEAPKSAKPAAKAKKASAAKPKKATTKPKREKAEELKYTPVALPSQITTSEGVEIKADNKYITITHGLREVIFPAHSAYYFRRALDKVDGVALDDPIEAGSVALTRGAIAYTFPPAEREAVNLILSAREAANKARKAEGGAA